MWIIALILSFILVPLIEVALFIQVGKAIGILATVAIVLALGAMGAILVKWQGMKVLREIMATLASGEIPGNELLEGVIVLVAGALLITPGFFTDAVSLAILLPPGRRILRDAIKRIAAARISRKVSRFNFVFRV